MKTREQEREERRQYHNDVFYEVWRAGGNPDLIDYERVESYREEYLSEESAASREMRRMYPSRRREESEEQ